MLQNCIVVVKRIIVSEHTVDDRFFDCEVKNLMKVSHLNVVRFLGFCSNTHREAIQFPGSADFVFVQKRERLLCFEYINNGSLDKHITDELRGLEWSVRYEIIKGILHGLRYLHMEINIIHMDLKPSNIMLDNDMVPKITDFGLSRLAKITHTSGTRFITHGYCAPEYENCGKMSKKVDMYSLGVIIIELVTGRKGDPNKTNISLCMDDDMLGINPLELRFPFELQKQMSSMVMLINKTKNYYAFNIETPGKQYRTEPNKGILSPQSEDTIQITLEIQETTPHDLPYSDNFIVQSTKVNGDFRAEDITKYMFQKEPVEVDEVNLTVVVYENEGPKEDLKIREDTKKKQKSMIESALSTDKPGVNTTHEAEAIHMEINSISYKYARGQCIKQPERLSFLTTPRLLCNQQTNMSDRAVDLVTGAMGSLHHKLDDLLKEEYNLEKSMKGEIDFLSEELRDMQLAIRKVSGVHRHNLDDDVMHWVDTVREMSYDIEDVVDGFLVHDEPPSNTSFFRGLIEHMFNHFKWGKTHNPIEDAVKDIKKQVEVVAERRKRWKVDETMANVASKITIDPRISAIYKDQKELVGIKEPSNVLIQWLSDKDGAMDVSKQQLKIVSIVGFAGLGKTTLAKAVYNQLQSQFGPKAFVPVGRNPNLKNVFEAILHGLSKESNAENLNEMQLINKIRGLLKNMRYFIVIDDIWDSPAWNLIKCALPNDDCGSCVVTTTRIRSVADDCYKHSRGYVHEMKPLNGQDSKNLFVCRMFGSPKVPEDISNDILKKCGGLPLAIISIASLLAHNQRPGWDSIRNSLVSVFEENHDDLKDMKQILDLSYMHLPHHLKTCLLDIGKYQEDQEIEKEDMLRQWTAQGFVSATRVRDAEDVAEDYFYELINMSMIQPGKMDFDEVLSCRVHDIMLDLIRSKATEENFNLLIDGPKVVRGEHKRVRRVAIYYDGEEDGGILAAINDGSLSHVRSVLLFRGCLVPSFLVLKYIRVLQLEGERGQSLDLTGIRALFLLRYLKIYCKKGLTLPRQIGELQQLETLQVEGLNELAFLPSDIFTWPRLSHISYLDGVVLPDGISGLKSLRTLRGIAFLESSVDNIKGLGELTKLRELEMFSELRICNESDKFEWDMHIDALRSSIVKLSGSLRSLTIGEGCLTLLPVHGWSSTLTPPRHLQKLNLSSCDFRRIPEWISQLRELYSLTLFVRELADSVSIVAGLPSLAYLELEVGPINLQSSKEKVIISGREFGALKHLILRCPNLSLEFKEGALPRLEKLHICFRYFMSAEFLPVGIKHLPVGTLPEIRLTMVSTEDTGKVACHIEQLKAVIRLRLKRAFELHHATADITVES
ncbi:disease resistance protein RGA5-like isoform X4 [Triticum dicoccoides]|uniref:disease resistance protein RGA5-like isoform X4 n=1 Tax=Triticum dicoccoides TaxID=85692 RepID=UPI00188DD860|nr:disease resistance protein RGA5-like isoform X4 [Triticum dicoccoides]